MSYPPYFSDPIHDEVRSELFLVSTISSVSSDIADLVPSFLAQTHLEVGVGLQGLLLRGTAHSRAV